MTTIIIMIIIAMIIEMIISGLSLSKGFIIIIGVTFIMIILKLWDSYAINFRFYSLWDRAAAEIQRYI